jgi:hypothetical protein
MILKINFIKTIILLKFYQNQIFPIEFSLSNFLYRFVLPV